MGTVFLVGFMATGKTTVARAVAERRGIRFVDLDRVIEQTTGESVSSLFADRGEAAFRELERDAARAVSADAEPCIVATGGGAFCDPDTRDLLRASGLVVALFAPLETCLARAATEPGTRPLLARGESAVADLYRERAPLYRRAHVTVDGARAEADVVADVDRLIASTDWLPGELAPLAHFIATADDVYPVVTEAGALSRVGQLCSAALGGVAKLGLVTDDNVAPLYAAAVTKDLERAGHTVARIVVPAGDGSKSFAELERVTGELVAAGLDRDSAVVALGGGMVGDLAGFAAATLFRGIRWIQLPTTLVAMTDAAIGGKTAINTAAGKNLVGAFWQPRMVLVDPATLATLPPRERSAGFGELIKYGALDGVQLLHDVVAFARTGANAADVIRRCAAYKCWIVSRDPRERTGVRALLNLGHTVGHAIEREAGYGQVLHGEAVGLGLIAAARVSKGLGLAEPALESTLSAALEAAGLSTDLDRWLTSEVLGHTRVDKKRRGANVQFITLAEIGDPGVTPIDPSEIDRILLA